MIAVDLDNPRLALPSIQQLIPTIRPKIRPILQQELHALWIVVLRGRAPIAGLPAHTLSRPDKEHRWRDKAVRGPRLGFVGSQGLDAVLEVGEEPAGGLSGACGEQSDFVEEVVKAGREGFKRNGAWRVDQDQLLDVVFARRIGFVHVVELAGDFVGDDAAGGPAAEEVGASRLAAEDFFEVEFGHAFDAAGVRGGVFHEGAVEAEDGEVGGGDFGDACVGGGGAGAVGEEEEVPRCGFDVALEEDGGGWRHLFDDGDF